MLLVNFLTGELCNVPEIITFRWSVGSIWYVTCGVCWRGLNLITISCYIIWFDKLLNLNITLLVFPFKFAFTFEYRILQVLIQHICINSRCDVCYNLECAICNLRCAISNSLHFLLMASCVVFCVDLSWRSGSVAQSTCAIVLQQNSNLLARPKNPL